MLILFNNSLSKKTIIQIIKINAIKKYSKLNKNEQLHLINVHKATIFIQQYFRKKYNEDYTCPITLCNLKYPFFTIKNHTQFRYYSLIEFIQYLNNSSSDFRDPITRESLTDHHLKQLDNLIKYYKIKHNINKRAWKYKLKIRSHFYSIINCLNDIINFIYSMQTLNFEMIFHTIIPQMIYYLRFLVQRHKNQTYSVINNYINILQNHPCKNKLYLVEYLKLVIQSNNL